MHQGVSDGKWYELVVDILFVPLDYESSLILLFCRPAPHIMLFVQLLAFFTSFVLIKNVN
jgi:hypothetical protein